MSIILKSGSSGNLANIDSLGNLFVASSPVAISSVSAPWTTATLVNAAIALMSVGGFPSILVQLNQTSTITGGAVTFEGTYDGINWTTLGATQLLDPVAFTTIANPYTLVANTDKTFLVQTNGMQQVRLRLSTVISGTGSVTTYSTLQGVDYGPTSQLIVGAVSVTQGTSPWVVSGAVTVSGSVTANIGTTGGLALDATLTGGTVKAQMYDGTNVIGTSAHPVRTDPTGSTIQPVSGTVTANAGTGSFTVAQATAANLNATVVGTGTFAVQVSTALPAGTNVIGHVITDTGSTTAVTGNVTVVQTTAANLNATVVFASPQHVIVDSGTVTANQGTSPWVVSLASTTITGTVAVTQSTSPWVVAGSVASGASDSGNPVKTGGVFNTTQPTVTNGQRVDNQNTARGAQIVATGVDTFNATINAPLPAGTNVIGHVITDSGSTTVVTGTVAVTQSGTWSTRTQDGSGNAITSTGNALDVNLKTSSITLPVSIAASVAVTQSTTPWTVAGAAASGAAKSGNPVQGGSVFNTTQPTVTTGQVVEAQATARGGLIVATGVDTFNVTINTALPAGTNVIGHVITDTGSTTAVTGNVTVVQTTGTNLHMVVDSGTITTITNPVTVAQATAANLNATVVGTGTFAVQAAQSGTWNIGTVATITNPVTVVGDSASGATNAGNPVKVGGVFNTTQPTVTNGQTVDAQATARGGLIVATGVDNFTVQAVQSGTWNIATVTAVTAITNALPAGTNVIGHVITDTGSTTAVTGTVTVAQSTAANLNATVVGTGTFVVQAQQSGTWSATVTQATAANLNATVVGTGTFAVQAAQSGTWNIGTVATITNPVTVSQATAGNLNATVVGTGTFAVQAAQSGTWNIGTLTTITNPVTIVGDAASGSAKAGNPVQSGAVFNTTQPTITTGQVVENQATARGGLIVSTGVDTFNVTVNAALPAGTNVIGHVITDTGSTTAVTGTVTVTGTVAVSGTVAVTQSTSPWVENLTQVAGTALGATAVTNFGSAPAAAAVPGVNANIFSAGAAITAAAPLGVQLSQGNAVISNTNPLFSSITDGTTKVTVIAATAALKTDLSSVAGTATVTAAAGVQKVGIVGNANATLDSANTAATAPTNAVLTSAMYNSTVPALTTGQAVAAECDTTGSLYSNPEGRKATYRVGVVGFTPIASATAPSISVTGSATKTIRITRIRMSITAGTGGATDISLKRFTALSGGTANSQSANIAKMDSGNAAQTAVVNQWSAAATTTTAAGIVNAERYEIVTAAVSVLPGVIEWTFGDKQGQSLVLRGTAEFAGFCITAVGTTPVCDCWIEWTEE